MRAFVQVLLFLMLVDEGVSTNVYGRFMFAPFKWVRGVLFAPIVQLRVCDLLLAAVLAVALFSGGTKVPSVRPMRRAMWVAAAGMLASLVHGVLTGGDPRMAGWQMYLLLALLLAAATFAAVFKTAEQFTGLLAVITVAGLYHAVMALSFYALYVRTGQVSMLDLGDYLSSHEDSVLWGFGVCFLLLRAFAAPTLRTRAAAALGVPLLLLAIQLNHRRLAWISLGAALVVIYALLPDEGLRPRIRRWVRITVPVLLLYVAVGWGRPEAVFRPLRSFQTVTTSEDASTLARNAENLGLIATARQGWLIGTGFGHPYQEVTSKYQIHFFELWPYVPHNSILGLLAYTGYLGFLSYWLLVPTAAFLLARLARLGESLEEQRVGLLAMALLVVVLDQWYGDMGSFQPIVDYSLAVALAGALRLPVLAGVWKRPPVSPTAEVAT